MDHFDMKYMNIAFENAEIALDKGEVPVGCAIVNINTKKVIATGYNQTNVSQNPTKHCEFVAIEEVLKNNDISILSHCDLYVTVEPCIMCAVALRYIQIHKVYYGCSNLRFGGCSSVYNLHDSIEFNKDNENTVKNSTAVDSLGHDNNYSYQAKGGIMSDKAIKMLRDFYARGNPNCPAHKRHRPLQQ